MINGPKPLIEEHYHIRELIDAQEKRAEDRQYYRDKAKAGEERTKLIADARQVERLDFHCSRCKVDYKCGAVLIVEADWTCPAQSIAYYRGKCRRCGERAIRYVTDKEHDGYYRRSRLVRADQGKHHADTLQPHEEGFNMLYGKPGFINNNQAQ